MSFCLWLPDVISYPIHPTHVKILNLSHKSQSHVLSDKQMLIKATCIVLQGKQDDQKCENVRHVSYLNTISKQNRIKHRNRFQMLVRTCFLVGCLFLTFSIALKIVLFFFVFFKSIYWQCQRYSFDVLESFLDVFLGLSFNQGYNVYNTFYSVLYWVTKMSNKKITWVKNSI